MVGSFSDPARIGPPLEMTVNLRVAGAVFGDVGGWHLLFRAL